MINIPFNESLLFWATPETESEPFMYELLTNHLRKGESAALCVTNKRSRTLINESKTYGYKLSKYQGKSLSIIDFSSELMAKKGVNELKKKVKSLVNQGAKLVCFNNISTLINVYGEEAIKALGIIDRYVKRKKGKCLLLFTEWPYDPELITKLRDEFTERVYLNTVDEGGFLRKYYSIKNGEDFKHVMFNIKKPGGVVNVAPKIIVAEPEPNFIESLSQKSVAFDQLSADFSIGAGELEHEGLGIDLRSVNNDRFNTIMDLIGDESTGVLVMIDSLKPETFSQAREVINSAKKTGLNVLVGLNNLKGDFNKIKDSIGVSGVNFIKLSKSQPKEEIIRKLLN